MCPQITIIPSVYKCVFADFNEKLTQRSGKSSNLATQRNPRPSFKDPAARARAVARGDRIGAARAGRLMSITKWSRHGSAATDRDAEVTGRRRKGTIGLGHLLLRLFISNHRQQPSPPLPMDGSLAMGFRSMSSPPPPNVEDFL